MTVPTLEHLEGVEGRRVLVRLDLNVPLEHGEVADASRIEAALPTLRWLLERRCTVLACSHLGRPKGAPDPRYSLRPVASELGRRLDRDVGFVAEVSGAALAPALDAAGPGALLVLENLRFHPGEKDDDAGWAAELAAPFSHYVNDAFGTAHRADASVHAVPRRFGRGAKAAGRLLAAELEALGRVAHRPEHPFVAVIGGAKVSSKTAPLEALLDKVDTLLIGGGMANTFLLAQGHRTGRSLVETDQLDTARTVLERARARGAALRLPVDLVVADDLESPTRVETVPADQIPDDLMALDIGPRTAEAFAAEIAAARMVFWNGPMGVFEHERFAAGTDAVARALAASPAFSVVGGGESVMAVQRAGVADRIGHVSTGGGASLELIAGAELPAVSALEA